MPEANDTEDLAFNQRRYLSLTQRGFNEANVLATARGELAPWYPSYSWLEDNGWIIPLAVGAAFVGGAAALGASEVGGEVGASTALDFAPAAAEDTYLGLRAPSVFELTEGAPATSSVFYSSEDVMDEWGNLLDDTSSADVFSGGVDAGAGDVSIPDYGNIPTGALRVLSGGGGYTQTGAMGGAMMAGAGIAARSLWSVLRAGGARFSTFISANGVKARLADLWPAVRKYGPQAVATALGVGLAELGTLLTQAPTQGQRHRRRGISAADIRRAKRVIRFNKNLTRQLGTGHRSGGYRPRYRRSARYC